MKQAAEKLGITYHAFRYTWTQSTQEARPAQKGWLRNSMAFDEKEIMAWYKVAKNAPFKARVSANKIGKLDNDMAFDFLKRVAREKISMASLSRKYGRKFGETKTVRCVERHTVYAKNRG
jgi:hypothetical protein